MKPKSTELVSHMLVALDSLVDRSREADMIAVAVADMPPDNLELSAIKWLGPRGATTMRALAEALAIAPSSATTLIDRMMTKGWSERWREESDRRIVLVGLSAAGIALWRRTTDERTRLCREMLESFLPAEQAQLSELLLRLAEPPGTGNDSRSKSAAKAKVQGKRGKQS